MDILIFLNNKSGVFMIGEVVKITDKKQINNILQARFIDSKIFIKTTDLNIQAESFLFDNGVIFITAPGVNEKNNSVIFYVRYKGDFIFSHATLKSKNDDGFWMYEPLDIQIVPVPRKEERKDVPSAGTLPSTIYISNIISDFTIHESLNLSRRKVDLVKDELLKKMLNIYPDSEIIFLNDKVKDSRMLFFNKKRKPYFIKNMKDIDDAEKVNKDEDLKYYKTFIHQNDSSVMSSKIISEICVPLLYKLMMPFGYVKTTSWEELNDEDFSVIRKFGMSASTVYTNDKQMITSSDEKIAVTDLSLSGLGIFFKEKTLIKHFKENALIIFTIFLPDKKQATTLCEVKNISLIKNYVYRIGCEILNIEALGEVYYSEYLEGLESR